MTLKEEALPLHEDAQFQLRPRLFLEGNLFVDTKPGSPNADEVGENHTFPVTQTSSSVQIDQVLTTLQSDVRANLQTFLDQFGNALTKYGGAEGFQELYRSSAGAFKYTSIVNEALQGTRAARPLRPDPQPRPGRRRPRLERGRRSRTSSPTSASSRAPSPPSRPRSSRRSRSCPTSSTPPSRPSPT